MVFFASDIRQGLGERRLFRIGINYLANMDANLVIPLVKLIPVYSRWDNMFCLLDTTIADDVVKVIKTQLNMDEKNMEEGESISLMAKWLPSSNASSKETKRLAHILIRKLGMTERQYRKTLSKLRSYLKLVEIFMSKKEWSQINYTTVPSRANLLYNKAFLRNDEERRQAYLNNLEKGETKIHAQVLFPHDIVHNYLENNGFRKILKEKDNTLEELWKSLPDFIGGNSNTICVADGSGSMVYTISKTNISYLEVANALAIYFSERSLGQFKDTYITFSESPKLVDFSKADNLREKLEIAFENNEIANTNIEAVFDLILQTAIKHHMKQEDLPQTVLILSDMEFDACAVCNDSNPDEKLFKIFEKRYIMKGYQLPRLVFWNLGSRTKTVPIKENKLGVSLVSGFSPNIMKMVLSNYTDPCKVLLEQLNSERYQPIEIAIRELLL